MQYPRLLKFDFASSESFFLFGPRGVGKTSWIKKQLKDQGIYYDLLNNDVYQEFLARPVRLSEKIPDNYKGWIVIDEIQKIPALLNEVHRLIEDRGFRFILTGSSARSLRRKGVNLLAGRALTYYMHPLTALELGDDFDFNRALQYGHLPTAVTSSRPDKYLSSYIKTYLREEVLQEGLTRNLALFSRFLEVASFSQGEVLNYTEIGREVGSNRHTIANFFDILEDMLIGYRLSVFQKRVKRDVIVHPKFYYFDVGIYRTLRPKGLLDISSEIDGPALETLFFQEAKAVNDYFELEYEFYYWRTRNQQEVDFVLYGNKGFCAFEIKRRAKLYSSDFIGLKTFAEDYPEAKLFLLYGGKESYQEGNIQVIPCREAIKNLHVLLNTDK